jgi:hypothetical protein
MPQSAAKNTIDYLNACRAYRKAGYQVDHTNNPSWLVNMAINRRAGWPDDPSLSRGSAKPVNGTYPAKASGDAYRHLRLIANEINSRVIVREQRLGEWKKLLMARIPNRITTREEEAYW